MTSYYADGARNVRGTPVDAVPVEQRIDFGRNDAREASNVISPLTRLSSESVVATSQSFYDREKRRRNRDLRDQLRSQPDVGGILDLAAARGEFWDAIGVGTALHTAAWKVREGARRPDFMGDSRWTHLLELVREKLPGGEARNLSNTIWSLASLACQSWPLFGEIAAGVLEKAAEFKTQEISNTSWAFATVRWYDGPLFACLAAETLARSSGGTSQDLTNTLWAFATVSYAVRDLFEGLCGRAADCAAEFKPQECANTLWAMAIAAVKHDHLVGLISCKACSSLPEFRTQNLSNFIWAYAKLGYQDEAVAGCILAEASQKLPYFTAQDVTTTVWAFSTMPRRNDGFLEDCVAELQQKSLIQPMLPQHASNTLWALATVMFASQPLFDFLSACVTERVAEFKPQELANTVWAFATVALNQESAVLRVSQHSIKKMCEFSCQSTANFIWAYAKLAYDDVDVIQCVQAAAFQKLESSSEQDLSTTMWAFSTMLHRDDAFLKGWVIAVKARAALQRVKPQHASNMLWAMATVPFHEHACFAELTESVVDQLAAFSPQDLSCCIWACATVVHRDCVFTDRLARESVRRLGDFDPQSIGQLVWGVSYLDTSFREVYGAVSRLLEDSTCLLRCNEKVLAMVARALFRGGEAKLAWKLFDQIESNQIDPGITAIGIWLHESRHQQPNAAQELQVLAVLSRLRPCRHLSATVLNAAALRLEELGEALPARALVSQLQGHSASDAVTQLLADRLGLGETSGACSSPTRRPQLCVPNWHMPSQVRGQACCDYDKQCKLLQHVLATANRGDPQSVIDSIERFSVDGNGWLKIAGGGKGVVLDELVLNLAPKPVNLIVEFGCFVGYSATRMARLLRPRGGRLISVEVDPVHACIARSTLEYAGLADTVSICVGYSEEVIPHLLQTSGGMAAQAVFMDQRGTRFHIDLQMLEAHGLMSDGCAVLGDNVLKPGAPHFLWYLQTSSRYEQFSVVSLREFASDRIEDWMSFARYCSGATGPSVAGAEPPEGMEHLAFLTDRARVRSCNPAGACEVDEDAWAQHSQEIRRAYEVVGIRPRIVHVCRHDSGEAFVNW
ncbi:unnamed protein product [Polarella glacialis]|uniref:RNA-editing substrate-binding complex 6 protein domain-containing protein n=1 Tax=Polarella glacialis TaxID=89957 RepID=A0A813H1S5_POLGL|nr:unnamed protein product [Polarella glacialis]